MLRPTTLDLRRRRRLLGGGLLLLLATLGGHAARNQGPAAAAPASPGTPAAPANPYTLKGDVTNSPGTGVSVFNSTSFASAGSWQFQTSAAGGTALQGYCPNGTGCWGVYGKALGASSVGVRGAGDIGVHGSSNTGTGVYAETNGTTALRARNWTKGGTAIIADGNVVVNGTLHTTGGVVAPVATQQGARLLFADQSTQYIFSDRGTATLKNGHVVVTIDPLYAETVNLQQGYEVFVTPNTLRTPGLGVVDKTATSFEVGELNGGRGNFSFDWRIEAVPKGYAQERLPLAPVLPAAPVSPTK